LKVLDSQAGFIGKFVGDGIAEDFEAAVLVEEFQESSADGVSGLGVGA
jgi:hypothetical protein